MTEKVPGFCRKQKIYKRLDTLRADRVSGNQNVDVFDKPFDVVACLGIRITPPSNRDRTDPTLGSSEGRSMTSIRRGIVWAFASQNLNLAINFASLLVLVRLLTPAEYGVSSLALAIIGIAEAVRELAGGSFIIREHDLTAEKIRSTTTVNMLVTALLSTLLLVAAGPLSRLFGVPLLAPFLVVSVLGYSLATFLYPQQALLGREMEFTSLAVVQLVPAVVGGTVSISLAYVGLGALSLAWGGVLSTDSALRCHSRRRLDLQAFTGPVAQGCRFRRVFQRRGSSEQDRRRCSGADLWPFLECGSPVFRASRNLTVPASGACDTGGNRNCRAAGIFPSGPRGAGLERRLP